MSDLGNVYYYLKKFDSARVYYVQGMKIAEKYQMVRDLGFLKDNIGLSLYQQKRYREALNWHQQGLAHRRAAQSELDIIANLNNLGKTYLELHQYDSAYVLARESYARGLRFKDHTFLREVTELLANVHLGLGHIDSAKIYQKYHGQYLDSISKQQQRQAAQGASVRIEVAKQVLENELLKSRNQQLFLIGALLVVALLGILGVSFLIYRQSRHRKHLLEQLRTANHTKDRLFAIIGHDLRSPIGSLKGLLDLVNSKVINAEEFLVFSNTLRNNVENVYFTLNNLLLWANAQMEGIVTQPEKIDLQKIAEENIGFLQGITQNKNIRIDNLIPENTTVWADYEQVSLVFRNLLSNAVKFTSIGGTVKIECEIERSFCKIWVKDTGVGMSKELIKDLFQTQKLTSRAGTMGEKGTGLGLVLCKDFIENNGGTIGVEQQEGEGAHFFFTLLNNS